MPMSAHSLKPLPTSGFRLDNCAVAKGAGQDLTVPRDRRLGAVQALPHPFGIGATGINRTMMGCSGIAHRQANDGV
jgi:hypothetical protein